MPDVPPMTALAATVLSPATLLPQDPPPSNAADLYREAFTAWEAMAAEDREAIANAFGDPQVVVSTDPETTMALERAGRTIDLFMQASRVDRCDWGLDRSEGFALLLPHLGSMRATYRPMDRERLRAKPGVTGLWQISYARQDAIHENIDYDLYYIENQSFLLDLVIVALTGFAVAKGTGAW